MSSYCRVDVYGLRDGCYTTSHQLCLSEAIIKGLKLSVGHYPVSRDQYPN